MAVENIDILLKLEFPKQITFAYLACERVFPNYVYYTEKINFGNRQVVRESIDYIYKSIFEPQTIDIEIIKKYLTLVYQHTPSTNDFPSFYGTIAMDSGGVVYESLNLLKREDTHRILIDISEMITNAIDCYIQERDDMSYNDPDFESKILNDQFMQNEIAVQKGIIAYLSKITNLETSDIDTLLKLQENKKTSLII